MFSFLKKRQENKRPRCAALVAAAGTSSRMGGIDKMLEPLDGIPILARSLAVLQSSAGIDEIIVATREESLVEIANLCHTYGITKCKKVIRGGETRVHSVYLAALEASSDMKLLAVHDGARPLATPDMIGRVITAAARCGAAAPAIPVKDTVKVINKDESVAQTLERGSLRAVQTPQVFEADLLKAALHAALEDQAAITDDCSAVERLGKVVFLVEGEEENLKITTPIDLYLAEAILRTRESLG